jgi:hypothetical protein
MDIGILVAWLSLIIYIIVLLKAKIIDKKERKWVYMLIAIVFGLSLVAGFNFSFNMVITFLNNTFGKLSRLVVNI